MIKATSNRVKALSRVLALGAAVLVTAASTRAHAVTTFNVTDTVSIIEVNQVNNGGAAYNLLVQLTSSTNYVAFLAPTFGCPATDIDTFKAWQSLTQSALLAGKKVRIFFTSCGGFNNIVTIDLNK